MRNSLELVMAAEHAAVKEVLKISTHVALWSTLYCVLLTWGLMMRKVNHVTLGFTLFTEVRIWCPQWVPSLPARAQIDCICPVLCVCTIFAIWALAARVSGTCIKMNHR